MGLYLEGACEDDEGALCWRSSHATQRHSASDMSLFRLLYGIVVEFGLPFTDAIYVPASTSTSVVCRSRF